MSAPEARKVTMKQTQLNMSITKALLASLAIFIGLALVVGTETSHAAPSGKFQYTDNWAGQPSGLFSNPNDVEVGPTGDVFVLDTNNSRIQVFDADGNYKYQFGSFGSTNGLLRAPLGMEVNGSRIYVADSGNNRIQVFTTTGEYVGQFGTTGSGTGQLSAPRDVTIVAGRIYVADANNNRITVWTFLGPTSWQWQGAFGTAGNGNGQFSIPFGIDGAEEWDQTCNDGDGGWRIKLYVADTLNNRIQKFQAGCGGLGFIMPAYETQWASTTWPYKVEVVNDDSLTSDVYVARTVDNVITRYSPTGVAGASWGTGGSGDGQLRQPGGVAINNATSRVYVADSVNNRVQRFSTTGTYQLKWGVSQNGDGEFSAPSDVARDSAGNIYVVDRNNDRVEKFSSSGRFLLKWGTTGTGNGEFQGPYGIYISASDQIYIADRLNNRIQVFDTSGNYVTKWGTAGTGNGQFSAPIAVTMISSSIYVLDAGNSRVQVFSAPGTYVTQWGTSGGGNGQFAFPKDIVTAGGYLFVSDNTRVQQFNFGGGYVNSIAVSGSPSGLSWIDNVLAVNQTDSGQVRFYRATPGALPGTGKSYCQNGSGAGQFSGAIGVDLLPGSEWDAGVDEYTAWLLTADSGNNRVTRTYIENQSCMSQGALGNTELNKPQFSGLAPNGDVFVGDSDSQRIVRYDSTGKVISRWGLGMGPDGFTGGIRGVAVGSDGTVYVVESSRVRRFSATGTLLDTVSTGGSAGQDIAVGNGNQVYRVGTNTVWILSQNLTFQSQIGSAGSGNGQFSAVTGIGMTPGGDFMVADFGNNRIQRFSPTGTYVSQFSTPSPRDVAWGPDGRIFVTGGDNIVRVYGSFGGPLVDQWGAAGSNAGQFNQAYGIVVNSNNRVFVNDINNNRVQLFDWLPSRIQYSSEATDYAGNQVNVPTLETTTVEGSF